MTDDVRWGLMLWIGGCRTLIRNLDDWYSYLVCGDCAWGTSTWYLRAATLLLGHDGAGVVCSGDAGQWPKAFLVCRSALGCPQPPMHFGF